MGENRQAIEDRVNIRPLIEGINAIENKSIEENFQNKTLRPIIKMQHELLIAYFTEYTLMKKCHFKELTEPNKLSFIRTAFLKDNAFKTELKGIVIGHFTVNEYLIFKAHKKDYNKRILNMIQQRLVSVLELL